MSERMNTNRSATASPVSICRVADMLAAIGIPESDDSCCAAAASTAAMPEISTARCLNGAGHASGDSIMQNEAAPATRPVIESPGDLRQRELQFIRERQSRPLAAVS